MLLELLAGGDDVVEPDAFSFGEDSVCGSKGE